MKDVLNRWIGLAGLAVVVMACGTDTEARRPTETEQLTPVANREAMVNDVPEHSVESLPYTPKADENLDTDGRDVAAARPKTTPAPAIAPTTSTRNEAKVSPQKATSPSPPPTNKPAPTVIDRSEETTAPRKETRPATPQPELAVEDETPTSVDHAPFDRLLKKHVSSTGAVNYKGFQADEAQLDAYLDQLENTDPSDLGRDARLAFWINAYNAYTIKLILDNGIPNSIRDIDKPWDQKWIEIGGETRSLNNIEHDLIRPRFQEPRIHFALVCAAKSCPPLANEAFTADNLNSLLESRTRQFIRNDKFNVTHEEVVSISPLFDWYGEDFGDVRKYLNRYLERDIPESQEITFADYDWSLNN